MRRNIQMDRLEFYKISLLNTLTDSSIDWKIFFGIRLMILMRNEAFRFTTLTKIIKIGSNKMGFN